MKAAGLLHNLCRSPPSHCRHHIKEITTIAMLGALNLSEIFAWLPHSSVGVVLMYF